MFETVEYLISQTIQGSHQTSTVFSLTAPYICFRGGHIRNGHEFWQQSPKAAEREQPTMKSEIKKNLIGSPRKVYFSSGTARRQQLNVYKKGLHKEHVLGALKGDRRLAQIAKTRYHTDNFQSFKICSPIALLTAARHMFNWSS